MSKCNCGCGQETTSDSRGKFRKLVKGHVITGEQKAYWRGKKGPNSAAWKGGVSSGNGYVWIYAPDHPRAEKKGYVSEHILVMEKALGRSILPTERPHHRDFNKKNNDPGNLILFKTHGMHTGFHMRLKYLNKEIIDDPAN